MAYLSQTSILLRPPDAVARWRLIICVTLLAVLLAVSVEHVYLISRTPWYESAYHLPLWSGIWYSAAAIAGTLVVIPVAIYALRERPEYPAGPWLWISVGVGFGIFVPIFTGFFTPLATLMIDWSVGNIQGVNVFPWIIDRLLRGFFSMFVDGAPAIRHGLAAGAVLALAGFAIDHLNARQDVRVAMLTPPAIAAVIGIAILLTSLFASPEFLRGII